MFFFFDKLEILTVLYEGVFPMKKNAGFTLIELLVVVLIIGILSAVALPQYRVAVEKARLSEALVNIKTMTDAATLFILENPSSAPTCFSEYSATALSGGNWESGGYETENFEYRDLCVINGRGSADVHRKTGEYSFWITTEGTGVCEGYEGKWCKSCFTQLTDIGRKICKGLESQGFVYADGEL